MKPKKYFNLIIVLLSITFLVSYQQIDAKAKVDNQPKVTVGGKKYEIGVYDLPPYYEVNDDGTVSGFYDDVLSLIQQDIQFDYEYVVGTLENHLTALQNNEIDFIFGVQYSNELDESFVFSHTGLSKGQYVLYGDRQFEKLGRPTKIALIDGDINNKLATHFLTSEGISYEEVKSKSWEESHELLSTNQVDLIMIPSSENILNEKIVYEFSTGPRYILGNQSTNQLLNLMDSYMKHSNKFQKQLINLQSGYTGAAYLFKNSIFFLICLSIIAAIIISLPKLYRAIIRHKISVRLHHQQYLVYYQPIIDPKTNQVKGLEALLRLEHAKYGILSPYYFMDEIIKSNSMKMVSKWIIKKVILDYQIIRRYQMHNRQFNPNFYVSINLSSSELEDEEFVEEIKQYIRDTQLPKHSICIELTEGTKIKNLNLVKSSIESLSEVGVRFAIDDFGVDYSNLNVLDKIRYDFIKVDKNFIDNVQTSDVNRAIIEFISSFTNERNISVVFEGVETQEQVDFISNTINMNSYIQGYYYAKPLSLEVIKFFGR